MIHRLIKFTGQKLVLPFYHIVSDDHVPHVAHLHPVRSVTQFTQDLDWLLKHYKPLSVADMVAVAQRTKQVTTPSFFLSFDDGLRECHDIIAPILKQKGIPAVFFINSAFIDNRNMSFRYKASALIDWFTTQHEDSLAPQVRDWLSQHGTCFEKVAQFLKGIDYRQKYLIDHLANTAGFSFAEYLSTHQPYMTREQVESLVKDGFAIGSHSVDHPEYRHLALHEQRQQTMESLQYVSQFYDSQKLFAFPFTDHKVKADYFEWLGTHVGASFGTAGLKHESMFPFHLQRIPMERSLEAAEDLIEEQYYRWVLKAPFGRNSIKRR